MADFGIGLGAFLNGVANGAKVYSDIQDAKSKKKLRDAQMQDFEQARQDKADYRNLSTQGMADAKANTDGQTDNVLNYYMKNTAPKLQQHWLETGDVTKAEAFGKWIQDTNVQQGMRHSAAMMRSAMTGDADGFAKNLVAAYNQPGYFDDGFEATSANVTRDAKGNAAGMVVKLRNQRTGEETEHTFNSMEDVYKMAQAFSSPDAVFSHGMKELESAQAARSKIAEENRQWDRTVAGKQLDHGYRVQEKSADQDFQLQRDNNSSQLRQAEETNKARTGAGSTKMRDAQATISMLKANGWSDDDVKANLPSILGIENRSRPVSSRIDDYVKMMGANDPKFLRLSQDEQISQARAYIQKVDSQSAGPGGGAGLPTRSGATGGQQGAGMPFYDRRTNSIIYR
ncbi:hypothetical protein PEp14_00026 [Erwinia phage PEp14]|uniref:Uncharacterized protein n=1 Tax=Erwinia phage PEp14 TaxID=1131315 RepID=H2DE56_9CAUD|nr:virion structural protein [Erwinia phage PEp14]AEY69615.1 hypothetical protein PEp14_00026 [Erwinia phage PEp14]